MFGVLMNFIICGDVLFCSRVLGNQVFRCAKQMDVYGPICSLSPSTTLVKDLVVLRKLYWIFECLIPQQSRIPNF